MQLVGCEVCSCARRCGVKFLPVYCASLTNRVTSSSHVFVVLQQMTMCGVCTVSGVRCCLASVFVFVFAFSFVALRYVLPLHRLVTLGAASTSCGLKVSVAVLAQKHALKTHLEVLPSPWLFHDYWTWIRMTLIHCTCFVIRVQVPIPSTTGTDFLISSEWRPKRSGNRRDGPNNVKNEKITTTFWSELS